jgi:valyl-tRNA synthetase
MDSSISSLFNTFYLRDEKLFKKLYPMSLRPQGQDIIRTWAYYSLLRGNLLTGENPWKEIMIDGNIMAPDGRPMHASWGNVVDPNILLEKYGADAFRYFTASCSLGEDSAFRERDLVRGQRLMNKIFNLVSFLEFYKGKQTENDELRPVDHWILRQMNGAIEQVGEAMNNFEFDRAIRVAESFVWHDLADNYVEIVKHRIKGFKTYETIYRVLLSSIKMISPIFPFISEDSYQRLFRTNEGKRSVFELEFPGRVSFNDKEAILGETTVEAIAMMRDLKVKEKISLSDDISSASIFASSDVKLDEDDVRGTIRSGTLSYERGAIDEKILSLKLTPELYSTLREKTDAFLKKIRENPSLLQREKIEFDGRIISTNEVITTKSYSIQGRNVNCGNGFCVSISK